MADVYDIFHPTPVSLKELSAITVSLELWRSQAIKSRPSVLEDFDSFLPDLPSTIRNIIYEFRKRFNISIDDWKRIHYKRKFQFHYNRPNSILEEFDDFVVDFNGSIHYVRTAERMMRSDRFDEIAKFEIACTYFFKDDIRRIWPSVRESYDLNDLEFEKFPQVHYWIDCLRDDSQGLSIDGDEQMFDDCMSYNRPYLEYFWAKLPPESQWWRTTRLYWDDLALFVRFILPKLDDQQLGEFVNNKSEQFMRRLFESGFANEWLWIPTWMYIKNKMNQSTVKIVVVEMLKLESSAFAHHSKREPKNWFDFCSVVWNSISFDWKRSMVENILSDIKLLSERPRCPDKILGWMYVCDHSCTRFVTFLLMILSSATSEQKSNFWHKCWPHLIERTRCEDLHQVMKLCLDNEDEIAQFIDNKIANSHHLLDACVQLLKNAHFNQLNDLIDFCYTETRKRMNFKQQLLRTTLYLEDSSHRVAFFGILKKDSRGLKLFTFIDNSFESVDRSAAFKNELMSSSVIRENLPCDPVWYSKIIDTYIELVETFVTSKQNVKDIKALMIPRLIAELRRTRRSPDRLLLWCLGSEKEVADFKQRYLT